MRAAALVLALGILAAPAWGQDAAALAAAERRAADKSLSTRERELEADRAIEIRRSLLRSNADDAKATAWMIDQAAALLARLGRDGSDSAAVFGIPLPAQREAAEKGAGEAAELLTAAKQRVEQAARATQDLPPDDPRSAAVEQDRGVRIPFFRARAEVILAALAQGAERSNHADAARGAIAALVLANPGPEAARRVNLAAALVLHRAPPDPADLQTALDECTWVVRTGVESPGAIPPVSRAEGWLGLAAAGIGLGRVDQALAALDAALGQPPFTEHGHADPLWCVLAADAATRALYERARATGDAALLARAVSRQDALLARGDLGLKAESLRPLVFEKLASLSPIQGLDTPPAIRLARAIVQARDRSQREGAMAALAVVAERPDAGPYAADALWELAVLLTQPPGGSAAERIRAATALTRLAREFRDHPRAQEAIVAALAHARDLAVESPDADVRKVAQAAYAQALSVATTAYTGLPKIDRWRYERARLLAEPLWGAPTAADLATALSLLEAMAPGAAVGADADRLYERVQTAALDGTLKELGALRSAGQADQIPALARDRAVPAARRAVAWAAAHASPLRNTFQLDSADAMVEAGDAQAAAIYQSLLPGASELPGGEARVRLGLARALILTGDGPGAFTHLRQVAASLDAPVPGGPVRAEAFWHSWTLMLELLAGQNRDGSRSGQIRAQIKRLQTIDAGLGGEPWKSRILKAAPA
jgi:hypothetical protein